MGFSRVLEWGAIAFSEDAVTENFILIPRRFSHLFSGWIFMIPRRLTLKICLFFFGKMNVERLALNTFNIF